MTGIPEVPKLLKDAYRERRLSLFVGSGLSLGSDVEGKFPRWNQVGPRLLAYGKEHAGLITDEQMKARLSLMPEDLPLAQLLGELDSIRDSLQNHYRRALKSIFWPEDARPGIAHEAVRNLDVQAVLTTNYDQLLEKALPSYQMHTWQQAADADDDISSGRRILFKVHGTVERPDTIVLTRREYEELERDGSYRRVVEHLLKSNTLLFVGYGMNDPFDLDRILRGNQSAFKHSNRDHFALLPKSMISSTEQERFRTEYSVRVVSYEKYEDVVSFLHNLREAAPTGTGVSGVTTQPVVESTPELLQTIEPRCGEADAAVREYVTQTMLKVFRDAPVVRDTLAKIFDVSCDNEVLCSRLLELGFLKVWDGAIDNIEKFEGNWDGLEKVFYALLLCATNASVVTKLRDKIDAVKKVDDVKFVKGDELVVAMNAEFELVGEILLKAALRSGISIQLGDKDSINVKGAILVTEEGIRAGKKVKNEVDRRILNFARGTSDTLKEETRSGALKRLLRGAALGQPVFFVYNTHDAPVRIPFLPEFHISDGEDRGAILDEGELMIAIRTMLMIIAEKKQGVKNG